MADSGYSPSGGGTQIERGDGNVFGALSGRFVALIILLVVLTNTFLMIILPNMMRDAALRAVARSNAQVADQVKAMRNFYSDAVIGRVFSKGILHPTWDWRNDELGVPLPATFVQEISNLLKDAETQIKLVSPYPWPHRAERKLDQFQSEAWTVFQNDPGATLVREERQDGGRVLRVAVSDRLNAPSCVACHNSDPLSPQHDWKLGDVRGVMEVVKQVEPDLASAEALATRILIVICGVSTLVVVVLLLFAIQSNDRVRERDALFAQIQAMAYTDGLSGLLNRGRFLECARMLVNESGPAGVFVLLVDLDRFKDINDEWGHAAGDGVIIEVARRLHRAIRPSDLVGRLGGDEFIVCGPLDGDQQRAERLSIAVVEAMRRPMRVRGRYLSLSASVGSAISGPEANTLDTLALNADLALYRAKELGRDRHVMFTPDLQQDHFEHRRIEKLLRLAIEQDSFGFAYQPIVDAQTRAVTAFEVLLRLSDGVGGQISPAMFIPLAEDLRLIGMIGETVMRKSFAFAAQWPEPIMLNVNLSPRQFNARENGAYLPDQVAALLKEAGLAPHRVTLEITETALLADTEAVFLQLEALRALGVKLALDDFGSGYSSLSYLWKFSFDEIKIDQSFSRGLKTHPVRLTEITASVVTLARSLSMDIVVEGIETECEATFFRTAGCDHLQGYLFSRPMPQADVAPYLMRTMTALAPVTSVVTDTGGLPDERAEGMADGPHGN